MNHFERQVQVRRLSNRLVVYFVIAVAVVVAGVDAAVLLAFNDSLATTGDRLVVAAAGAVLTVGLIGVASAGRMAGLRGGGGRVARQMGGTPVPPSTQDPRLRRLRNVVEEVAIASAVPVPDVYVLEDERSINAFAAGHTPADAAVAVTSGALERLNRRELEGVIAHEFSHVVNGDMRLNVRLIGVLFGIQVLAITGRVLLRGGARGAPRRSRRSGGLGHLMLVGLAAMAVGYLGVLMGRVIKAAVSRQREYLADASAVQFTRQTEGLVGALKKIGGLPAGSKLEHGKVDEVSHMLFGNGLRSSWLATHPPVAERIRALDPSFDPAELEALARRWATAPPSGLDEDRALGLTPATPAVLPDPGATIAVDPATAAGRAANPDEEALGQAAAMAAAIPGELRERAHDEAGALPLVLGLLLAADPSTKARQHRIVGDDLGPEVADAAWADAAQVAREVHPLLRLPLCELAFPALVHRDPARLEAILTTVHALIWVGGDINVHEYCLSRLLYRDLNDAITHAEPPPAPRRTVEASSREVATLLAVVAGSGHADPGAAARAYEAGAASLGLTAPWASYQVPAAGVLALEEVWPVLDGVHWSDRGRLVESLLAVAGHDGVMSVAELELVRVVCAMLRCPIPPQLPALEG